MPFIGSKVTMKGQNQTDSLSLQTIGRGTWLEEKATEYAE